jgi:hypothetical protein
VSEGVSDGVNTYFQFLCLHFSLTYVQEEDGMRWCRLGQL